MVSSFQNKKQIVDFVKLLLGSNNNKQRQLQIGIGAGIGVTVVYLALVRFFRYRRINKLKQKYPNPRVALYDSAVAEEVFTTTTTIEFPFLSQTSLELALFRTYAVPSISKILHATGEFSKQTLKRAEDTGIILAEALDVYEHIERLKKENPNVSQEEIDQQRARSDISINRLNEIHGKYPIKNGDFVYTLSLFICEPIKWINKHGWRKLEPLEENAIFRTWYDLGVKMNIEDIPKTLEAMFEFNKTYAQDNVDFAPSNWKVGKPTVDLLLKLFPSFMGPAITGAIPATLETSDIKAFGLELPKPWVYRMVHLSFSLHSNIVRYFMFPRWKALLRTPVKPDPKTNLYKPMYELFGEPPYPNGYCIYELGPDKFKPSVCPVKH
ncbi:hypothetical protein BDA99DRAFT_606337 [Phascolomyces articulosus]|uniref:Uncharacterized protein n=1 Tax=Phascolomyces articulosus TaxID=60185 RepID=A0AAD5PC29_9FUNG|nr:hypothetical protein BDA99DRAFT_606337 [Phascolomyces articulosus]